MRGTATHPSTVRKFQRITPACAGNSQKLPHKPGQAQDHPRVCGEQQAGDQRAVSILGSPPRVRGTDNGRKQANGGKRITPACAGNSCLPAHHRAPVQDHPRVCGEQLAWALRARAVRGSPPRVRGTDNKSIPTADKARITPACAGNSGNRIAGASPAGDHPRVCGEQSRGFPMATIHMGSPPRVRGTAP